MKSGPIDKILSPSKFFNSHGTILRNYGMSLVFHVKDERIDRHSQEIRKALGNWVGFHLHQYPHSTVSSLDYDRGNEEIAAGKRNLYFNQVIETLNNCHPFNLKIADIVLEQPPCKDARLRITGDSVEMKSLRAKISGNPNPPSSFTINLATFSGHLFNPAILEQLTALIDKWREALVGEELTVQELSLVYHQNNFLEDNLEEHVFSLK